MSVSRGRTPVSIGALGATVVTFALSLRAEGKKPKTAAPMPKPPSGSLRVTRRVMGPDRLLLARAPRGICIGWETSQLRGLNAVLQLEPRTS